MEENGFVTKEDFVFDEIKEHWIATMKNGNIKLYASAGCHHDIYSSYILVLSAGDKEPIYITTQIGEYYEWATKQKEQDKNALLQWGLDMLEQIQYLFLLFQKP